MENLQNIVIMDFKAPLIRKISQELSISEDNAERIFTALRSEKYPFLGNELSIIQETAGNNGLIALNGTYSLNIKKSLLVLIAFALDIKVTYGVASLALQITGLDGQVLYKLNQENGEQCIAREIILNKYVDKNILSSKECLNNDLPCKHRIDGQCKCSSETVEKILEKLEEHFVIRPANAEGVYQMNI